MKSNRSFAWMVVIGLQFLVMQPVISRSTTFLADTLAQPVTLREQFANPPQDVRPWGLWCWDSIDDKGVTADLEAMQHAGLGGAFLMYTGKQEMSVKEWKRMISCSMREAERLGMSLGMAMVNRKLLPSEKMQKVVWSDTIVNGGSVRNLTLPVPDDVVDGYYEDIAAYILPAEKPASEYLQPDEPLALYQGRLTARLPEGQWRILRMGHTVVKTVNEGSMCDRFSLSAVQKWCAEGWARLQMIDEKSSLDVLKYIYADCMGCGAQNWGENFAQEFQARRGYDVLPYLPLLAGIPMENAFRSEEVRRDMRTTVRELVENVFYATVVADAQEHGCLLCAGDEEDLSVAPFFPVAGCVSVERGMEPGGGLEKDRTEHADTVAWSRYINHLWSVTPASLKPSLDRDYAQGKYSLHYFAFPHNSSSNCRLVMLRDGNGSFFQRGQTWWNEGKNLTDYMARCKLMLLYGNPVVERQDNVSSAVHGLSFETGNTPPVMSAYRDGDEYGIFFIANQTGSPLRPFVVSFSVTGKIPEFWDAVTGEVCRAPEWKEACGHTEVTLSLPAYGSLFVVFQKKTSEGVSEPVGRQTEQVFENRMDYSLEQTSGILQQEQSGSLLDSTALSYGPTEREWFPLRIKEWTVTFSEIRKSVTCSVLFDWSLDEDEQICYYSGHANYKGLFLWEREDGDKSRIILSLGKVAHIATVRINSISCGTLWTAPYETDITDALRAGTNVIEVEVVNTWVPALYGATHDKAPFWGIPELSFFQLPDDKLPSSGWLGPCGFFRKK